MNQNTKRLKQELQQLRDEYNRALEPLNQVLQQARDKYNHVKTLLDEAEAKQDEARNWLYKDVDKFGPQKGCWQRKEIITKELETDYLVFDGYWHWASDTDDLDYEECTSYKYKDCNHFDGISYKMPEACKGCKYEWQYKHYIECSLAYCYKRIEFDNGGYAKKVEQAQSAIKECEKEYLPKIKNAEHAYLKQKWGFLFPIVIKIKQSKNL